MSNDNQAAIDRRVDLLGPCEEWTGAVNNNGYGPHRQIYVKAFGPPPEKYDVAHTCHNRRCIRLSHLIAKPRDKNMEMSKDRPKRGKLEPREVKAVRALLDLGYTQHEVAEILGIFGSTVCKIHIGMHYADI